MRRIFLEHIKPFVTQDLQKRIKESDSFPNGNKEIQHLSQLFNITYLVLYGNIYMTKMYLWQACPNNEQPLLPVLCHKIFISRFLPELRTNNFSELLTGIKCNLRFFPKQLIDTSRHLEELAR